MQDELKEMLPSKWKFATAIIVLSLSLAATLFNAGYGWRKVDEIQGKIESIEKNGVIAVKVQERDIDWLKKALEDNNTAHYQMLGEIREIRRIAELRTK